MKYMKLNIQLLFALVFLLGIFSCSDENEGSGKKEIREGLPTTVSLKLTSATPMVVETKSLDDGTTFGEIKSLAILVYKTDGTLDKLTYVSGVNAKNWNGTFNATTGRRQVYVLANSPLSENEIKRKYASEKELLNSNLIATNSETPVGNEQMLGFVKTEDNFGNNFTATTSDEIEIAESVDGSTPVATLYSRLYPPYSKITFTVKNEVKTDMSEKVELKITNVYVRNLPNRYSLLPNPTITTSDVKSDKVLLNLDDQNEAYEFYMYENPQGIKHKDNTDPKKKSPFENLPTIDGKIDESYDNWDTKWATKTPCTYIEVEGTYAIWKSANKLGAGDIHYRFFLGENTTTNFDIKRNTHYKIELAFKKAAGYDELEYEWRVYANLNDAVIIPEGELDIDGACDAKFPFYVINTTDGTLKFSLKDKEIGYSDLQFDYTDVYENKQSGHSKPELDLLPKKKQQGLYSFDVYPVNIGVLGSSGHSSFYGAPLFDCYRYYGEGDEVGESGANNIKLNFLLREDIANGLIFRKRTVSVSGSTNKTLIIKEYPLLFLGDNEKYCDINNQNAIYAQRIDMKFVSSFIDAKKTCSSERYIGPHLHYQLPTSDNLSKIVQYERKFPLKEGGQYWTDKGLWSPTGVVDDSKGGYVRCVYRK